MLKLDGPILDDFNHTLECTGRFKKFLTEEYAVTIEGKVIDDD